MEVTFHEVNMFKQEPFAIRNIAFDKSTSQLAVSKADFTIEIWNMKNKPFLQMAIAPNPKFSVETIAWCSGHLFSANLQGYVVEYDLSLLKQKHIVKTPTNSSVWCIGVNKQQNTLAAGTEDGHICLFDVHSGNFALTDMFHEQGGKVMCLDWHESGDTIVTGSIDSIHIWNTMTKQMVERIMVGRADKNTETIVWCIAVTSDMTIISGDSRGFTCFWDGNTGVLSSSAIRKADVLALRLSEDESTVYTAGVNPTIVMYTKSQTHPDGYEWNYRWMKSGQRDLHTHDVFALELAGEYLISGGVDASLVFSKFPPKIVVKHSPFSLPSYTSVAPETSFLMLKYPKFLEIWKFSAKEAAIKYAVLKSKLSADISSSAISPDGNWIAYTTAFKNNLKLYQLLQDDLNPRVRKVHPLPNEVEFCNCLTFVSNQKLALATLSRNILILICDPSQPTIVASLENGLDNVHLMEASLNENFLAVSSREGKICIYDMTTCEVHSWVPFYQHPVTAMKFDIESTSLLIAYSDRKVIGYDLENHKYSDWCTRLDLNSLQDCSPYAFRGIAFLPQNKHKPILYDEENVYVINTTFELEPEIKRRKNFDTGAKVNFEYDVIRECKYLLDLFHLNDDELVGVEVMPEDIHLTLPPPLHRKKYGT